LTCEDKSFVARRQIFSEVSSLTYELQVINSRLYYEIKLVELGWERRGTDTTFLKVAGFACHKASAKAAVLGECTY